MNSTADTDDTIEISADGISVRKTFAADEFPVPAIRFEIESDRDNPVTFQLSEDIPESFPMDKVGFHPDYHSNDWTAYQDNHVEFTGALEAGDQLVTVYGIQLDDESRATEFLTEPLVVELDADDANDDDDRSTADEVDDEVISNIVSEDRNQAVKDMIAGDSDTVPGLKDEESQDDVAVADETAADPASDSDPEADATADASTDESTALEDESAALDLDLGDVDPDPEPVDIESDDEDDETPDIDLGFEEEEIPEPADDDGSEAEDDELGVDLDLEADDEPADEGTMRTNPRSTSISRPTRRPMNQRTTTLRRPTRRSRRTLTRQPPRMNRPTVTPNR